MDEDDFLDFILDPLLEVLPGPVLVGIAVFVGVGLLLLWMNSKHML